ncbi:MAG: hypothetical protein BWY99_02808 [Synergistetes bacterium ADurb.BinA166]|nr:MAG: hypothetical protein BWY99_02808 [Synergistetes bacterium ADurb.BinA166]
MSWSSCLSATPATQSASLRGVAMALTAPCRIRFAANSFRIISSMSAIAFGRKAAGISSVPISRNSSFGI